MMSDELNVINDEDKGRNVTKNKMYVTAGAVGACVVVLMLLSVASIGTKKANDEMGFANRQINVAGMCRSQACNQLSSRLNESISPKESPCQNFYRFVCSGKQNKMVAQRQIALAEGSLGASWVAETLKESFRKVESNPKIPVRSQTDAQKFLTFYLSCYHSLAPGSRNVRSLKHYMHMFNFSWPKVKINEVSSFDLLVRMELDFNIGSFFRFGISLKRQNAWDFTLKPPKISKFMFAPTRKENYKKYLEKVVRTMGGGLKHGSIVDAIAKFEEELFELAVMEKKQRVHLRNLSLLTPTISPEMWMETFSKYFVLSKFLDNHTMVISSPEYFRKLFNSLSKKEGALYLGWRIFRFGSCFTNEFRALEESMEMNVDSCSHPVSDARDYCREYASKMMLPQMIAFATESLTSKDEVRSVVEIADNVKREILKGLGLNPWLDNNTKLTATQKVQNSRLVLPEIGLRAENTSVAGFPDLGADFLENWVRVVPRAGFPAREYEIEESMRRLYDDHVKYDVYTNELHLPIASTKGPLYSADLPVSTIYAVLGRVIAHELLHGLDAQGRDINNGQAQSWWSEDFADAYNAKAACYVNLYENVGNYTNNTIQEDIIDNAAVRYAYAAFKTALPSDKVANVLGGLSTFSPDQTFFITYCHNFCEKTTDHPEAHGGWTKYSDGHNRCNVPLMNMEEFAHAFSCTMLDPMNPAKKCYLW
ncbi:neprilysin-1-like [Dermacentor andersoni]|uniref:neprilysin-1-like n=1 Tax=Dermacentor andersoni TaxID=34620 RepID=UPI003B39FBF7